MQVIENTQTLHDDQIIEQALEILLKRMSKPLFSFSNLTEIKRYVRIKIGLLPYEVFTVFFLDAKHGLIACEEMFRGTLTQTSVYPREVARRALELNAESIICAHNHPSGHATPSPSDEGITQILKHALRLLDIRLLDHIVVSAETAASMAELGLM